MYANDIIENVERKYRRELRGYWLATLGRCQQFWIGESSECMTSIYGENWVGKPLITEEFIDYIRLPYPNTMVCFTMNYGEDSEPSGTAATVIKRAVYANQAEAKIHATSWGYYEDYNLWVLSPVIWEIDQETGKVRATYNTQTKPNEEEYEQALIDDACDLATFIASLIMLNCQNITTEEMPSGTRQERRKRKREGKKPLLSYHVLMMDGGKGAGGGKSAGKGFPQRVHLCRGHFKNYTDDAPLFGKYTGMYWWQPHVRGTDKSGLVLKDYDATGLKEEADE
jgi:hypothetical protein